MMLKLVKPQPSRTLSTGLTMGGPPPARFAGAVPGLTYAQAFVGAPAQSMPGRATLRLVALDGLSVER